ncbi:NADP-binding protein [Dacryopinax primogenitus]|uniref:NADP-binding protein n=1 Tax=Dacryopinax primogenitus (strain DJM 731) TaxID=1858805 RepID=M5FWT7_DACPD|nr:NADP-binding protein [Dacryopinax primogenitus]EJU00874.1 NADP-binding protein [Dacryopinax primogenitus]
MPITPQFYTSAVLYFVLSTALLYLLMSSDVKRGKRVGKRGERVLVLGGGSGIGRSIALLYAKRGARVCIVARSEAGLEEVKGQCLSLLPKRGAGEKTGTTESRSGSGSGSGAGPEVISLVGDIASVDDLVRVRQAVQDAWGGLDTLVLSAGISSLKSLMHNAGVQGSNEDASSEGLAHLQEIVRNVSEINYVAAALVAGTFFPMLERTSKLGAVMLISSSGALIPAPTRTIYGSTKAGALMLYQALAIEHPALHFSLICPGTVNTNFRASAPDEDDKPELEEKKLEPEEVAQRAIEAVDSGERLVIMPFRHKLGHILYNFGARRLIENQAAKKYRWTK